MAMSEIIQDAEELDAVELAEEIAGDEVGLTSEETAKKSRLKGFTIYDSMLLVALLCATLATLLLFFELRDFGNFPFSFPWKTSEF
jgi:hypothetical protein